MDTHGHTTCWQKGTISSLRSSFETQTASSEPNIPNGWTITLTNFMDKLKLADIPERPPVLGLWLSPVFLQAGRLKWAGPSDGTIPVLPEPWMWCVHTRRSHTLKASAPSLFTSRIYIWWLMWDICGKDEGDSELCFCALCCWRKPGSQAERPLCAVVILKWLRVGRLIRHCGRWMILLLFCPG